MPPDYCQCVSFLHRLLLLRRGRESSSVSIHCAYTSPSCTPLLDMFGHGKKRRKKGVVGRVSKSPFPNKASQAYRQRETEKKKTDMSYEYDQPGRQIVTSRPQSTHLTPTQPQPLTLTRSTKLTGSVNPLAHVIPHTYTDVPTCRCAQVIWLAPILSSYYQRCQAKQHTKAAGRT